MLIQVKVPEKIFLKNPEETDLGRRIIEHSIILIDEIGFESFNFKKLSEKIGSTEASVYRYFENKHTLLVYLISWYWNWFEFKLKFNIHNIDSPIRRLKLAIETISKPLEADDNFIHVDEIVLHRIVVRESSKAYLTILVDEDNKEGFFLSYKRICGEIASIVKEVNPNYKFPNSLVSALIELCHKQHYFAEHLPSLTDINLSHNGELSAFLLDIAEKTLDLKKNSLSNC